SAKANQSDNFTRTSNSVASSAAALVGETAYTDTILYRQSGFFRSMSESSQTTDLKQLFLQGYQKAAPVTRNIPVKRIRDRLECTRTAHSSRADTESSPCER
ncbi:hypothetical protein, partial [Rhizobium sp. CSW-27]|uniref:hypothetical protein n=1 Tax=Rhizobium sp. CSW-27 TaxID=2839985 RepID=UPI001C03520A